jgi:hypothetical protein
MRAAFSVASVGGNTRFSTRTDSMALMGLVSVGGCNLPVMSVLALTSH